MRTHWIMKRMTVACLLLGLVGPGASAQELLFVGMGQGPHMFEDANIWDPMQMPDAGSEITINRGVVTLSGDRTVQALNLNKTATAEGGFLINGGTLNLADSSRFNLASATIGSTAKTTNQGAFQWTSGTITGLGLDNAAADPDRFVIGGTGTRRIEGATLTNTGRLTHDSGSINLDATGVIDNQGTYEIRSNASLAPKSGSSVGKLMNSGTLLKTGSLTATLSVPYEDSAMTRVEHLHQQR